MSSHAIHSMQTAERLRANHRADVDLAMAKRHFLKKTSHILTLDEGKNNNHNHSHEDPHAMALRLFYGVKNNNTQNSNNTSNILGSKDQNRLHRETASSTSSFNVKKTSSKFLSQEQPEENNTNNTKNSTNAAAADADLKKAKEDFLRRHQVTANTTLLTPVESVTDTFLRKRVAALRMTVESLTKKLLTSVPSGEERQKLFGDLFAASEVPQHSDETLSHLPLPPPSANEKLNAIRRAMLHQQTDAERIETVEKTLNEMARDFREKVVPIRRGGDDGDGEERNQNEEGDGVSDENEENCCQQQQKGMQCLEQLRCQIMLSYVVHAAEVLEKNKFENPTCEKKLKNNKCDTTDDDDTEENENENDQDDELLDLPPHSEIVDGELLSEIIPVGTKSTNNNNKRQVRKHQENANDKNKNSSSAKKSKRGVDDDDDPTSSTNAIVEAALKISQHKNSTTSTLHGQNPSPSPCNPTAFSSTVNNRQNKNLGTETNASIRAAGSPRDQKTRLLTDQQQQHEINETHARHEELLKKAKEAANLSGVAGGEDTNNNKDLNNMTTANNNNDASNNLNNNNNLLMNNSSGSGAINFQGINRFNNNQRRVGPSLRGGSAAAINRSVSAAAASGGVAVGGVDITSNANINEITNKNIAMSKQNSNHHDEVAINNNNNEKKDPALLLVSSSSQQQQQQQAQKQNSVVVNNNNNNNNVVNKPAILIRRPPPPPVSHQYPLSSDMSSDESEKAVKEYYKSRRNLFPAGTNSKSNDNINNNNENTVAENNKINNNSSLINNDNNNNNNNVIENNNYGVEKNNNVVNNNNNNSLNVTRENNNLNVTTNTVNNNMINAKEFSYSSYFVTPAGGRTSSLKRESSQKQVDQQSLQSQKNQQLQQNKIVENNNNNNNNNKSGNTQLPPATPTPGGKIKLPSNVSLSALPSGNSVNNSNNKLQQRRRSNSGGDRNSPNPNNTNNNNVPAAAASGVVGGGEEVPVIDTKPKHAKKNSDSGFSLFACFGGPKHREEES